MHVWRVYYVCRVSTSHLYYALVHSFERASNLVTRACVCEIVNTYETLTHRCIFCMQRRPHSKGNTKNEVAEKGNEVAVDFSFSRDIPRFTSPSFLSLIVFLYRMFQLTHPKTKSNVKISTIHQTSYRSLFDRSTDSLTYCRIFANIAN